MLDGGAWRLVHGSRVRGSSRGGGVVMDQAGAASWRRINLTAARVARLGWQARAGASTDRSGYVFVFFSCPPLLFMISSHIMSEVAVVPASVNCFCSSPKIVLVVVLVERTVN